MCNQIFSFKHQTIYRDGPCLKPDSRIRKRIFDMPEHYGFVGQVTKLTVWINIFQNKLGRYLNGLPYLKRIKSKPV